MFCWKENIENRLDTRERWKDQMKIDMEKKWKIDNQQREILRKIRGLFGKQLVCSYTKRNIIQLVVSI